MLDDDDSSVREKTTGVDFLQYAGIVFGSGVRRINKDVVVAGIAGF